jgi:hypothetical protein
METTEPTPLMSGIDALLAELEDGVVSGVRGTPPEDEVARQRAKERKRSAGTRLRFPS